MINRIDYKNPGKKADFEIVGLQDFFTTRPTSLIQRDARLNFWAIIFITAGSGRHSIDFTPHSYSNGDVIFIQKNQVHHFEVNNKAKGYIIHINEPFFFRIEGFNGDIFLEFVDHAFGSPVMPFDLNLGGTNTLLLDLIYREYRNPDKNFNIELIASLFQSLILSLRAEIPQTDKIFFSKDYKHFWIFRQLIEEHYTETRYVEDYAGMMGLTAKTVNQAVRRVVGLSAKQFIKNRIILELKRYLSQGELLNYEIAEELGFDEAANMTNFFSRNVGMSPKAFRDSIQSGK
ncbi:MAG: helix-turn-helix transcriptional regulator [Spirochaetales bacterium]|uniref:Helix-turn-helix transcriptional regulator n=1 Tax=Candidatus Thalassospirochaeta sargassi TaxID=3119039 RepID=A0AAJ1IE18_9SPIO|nr:helix-turn-helix transcriptional regulator [Spirochaetales bacterium]